jgi:hypothetical protein
MPRVSFCSSLRLLLAVAVMAGGGIYRSLHVVSRNHGGSFEPVPIPEGMLPEVAAAVMAADVERRRERVAALRLENAELSGLQERILVAAKTGEAVDLSPPTVLNSNSATTAPVPGAVVAFRSVGGRFLAVEKGKLVVDADSSSPAPLRSFAIVDAGGGCVPRAHLPLPVSATHAHTLSLSQPTELSLSVPICLGGLLSNLWPRAPFSRWSLPRSPWHGSCARLPAAPLLRATGKSGGWRLANWGCGGFSTGARGRV